MTTPDDAVAPIAIAALGTLGVPADAVAASVAATPAARTPFDAIVADQVARLAAAASPAALDEASIQTVRTLLATQLRTLYPAILIGAAASGHDEFGTYIRHGAGTAIAHLSPDGRAYLEALITTTRAFLVCAATSPEVLQRAGTRSLTAAANHLDALTVALSDAPPGLASARAAIGAELERRPQASSIDDDPTPVASCAEQVAQLDRVTAEHGPDHPQALVARYNLAVAYSQSGHCDRAIPLYQRVLLDAERLMGPDHPGTLATRNNLAFAYASVGDFAMAITVYRQALEGRERVLGADHPDTLASRKNLADVFAWIGRSDLAMEKPPRMRPSSGASG